MAQKLSISLSADLCEFMQAYQQQQGLSSRSEVIARALSLLQEHVLEASYHAANSEWNAALDNLSGDQ